MHLCPGHEVEQLKIVHCWQDIVKAGVCARADAHKVGRDFDMELQGIEELTDHPVVRADDVIVSRSLASNLFLLLQGHGKKVCNFACADLHRNSCNVCMSMTHLYCKFPPDLWWKASYRLISQERMMSPRQKLGAHAFASVGLRSYRQG